MSSAVLSKGTLERLLGWYTTLVRPFLTESLPGRIEDLDRQQKRLEDLALTLDDRLPICFLGAAGVGKSTLINALVGGHQTILPSGGIGPLTAQALTVLHAEVPYLEAVYHKKHKVYKLIFALEQMAKAKPRPIDDVELSTEERTEISNEIAEDEISVNPLEDQPLDDQKTQPSSQSLNRLEFYKKQGQLMVTGTQDQTRDLPYLIDALRTAIGMAPIFGNAIKTEDEPYLVLIKAAVESGESGNPIFVRKEDPEYFSACVHTHAAGHLAPLVSRLTVGWNCELLKNHLELVDLPGTGVTGDLHSATTQEWVRQKAKAIVLVVESRGMRNEDSSLLQKSGFLARMLHSHDDRSADPVSLVVVAVKNDIIASELYRQDRERNGNRAKRTRAEHLSEVCAQAVERIRSQLQDYLIRTWGAESEAKRQVAATIMERLRIHAVATTEYRDLLFLKQNPNSEDRPSISDLTQSFVPDLSQTLAQIATEYREARLTQAKEVERLFFSRCHSPIEIEKNRWLDDHRAEADAETLRRDMKEATLPQQQEFIKRQAQFREILRREIPAIIEAQVLRATGTAQKGIKHYLESLREAHWKTLQASVRHEGTYFGARHINLPSDLASMFEEPLAEAWAKNVLKKLREETRQYATICEGLVGSVCDWAKQQGSRVQPALIEAQREDIRGAARQLQDVGKELIDELRSKVRTQLVRAIEGPIRRKCRQFVGKNSHTGTGTKKRIVELYEEIADESLDLVNKPAIEILTERFGEVEKEIHREMKTLENPIENAIEAIAESEKARLERRNRQQKGQVLKQIEQILAAAPLQQEIALRT